MKNEITKLIIFASLFCSYNFTAFSQATVEFETITEALNYTGDRDVVKKLVITGTISGDAYYPTSEWSKFRTLDTTFPNLEDIEILTSQNIPNMDGVEGLFFDFDEDNRPRGSKWLKNFSAPNVKGIGFLAFGFCENLLSANFPQVTRIGRAAFTDCVALLSVDLPLVTRIGVSTFRNCENLLSADFPLATEIDSGAFSFCNNLISANFPQVTEIESYAFEGCKKLSSINSPLVRYIETGAFRYCENLSVADFPLVTYIGNYIFENCKNLSSVKVNSPLVTHIGNRGCEKLLLLADFPLVTHIGSGAFRHCENLTTIDFPMVYEILMFYSFSGCSSLTSVAFGTGFTTPTTIYFYFSTFGLGDTLTKNIDLVLGEYVLPAPNLTAKTWQSDSGRLYSQPEIDYVWKSITIKTSDIEEVVKNSVVNIFPNPTSVHFTISFDLEKSCNMKIVLCDILGQELVEVYNGFTSDGLFTRTHNTEHLAKGVYFLKIFIDGNIVVEKVIVE